VLVLWEEEHVYDQRRSNNAIGRWIGGSRRMCGEEANNQRLNLQLLARLQVGARYETQSEIATGSS
jgi:hypothetical protein